MNQNLFINTCASVHVKKAFLSYSNVSQIEFVKAYFSIDIILQVSDLFLCHSCSQFYIYRCSHFLEITHNIRGSKKVFDIKQVLTLIELSNNFICSENEGYKCDMLTRSLTGS